MKSLMERRRAKNMKLKAMFSKVVAVLCIVTIFISSFHVSVFDSKASAETEKGYELVTLSDLTDNYEPGNVTAKTVFTKSSALTWAGTVFEGEFEFYNTSGNQANMLLLGNTTNSRGLKVYLQNETTLRVRFQDKPGASARTKDVDITAENVQLEKFTNQKLKLKIQFDFKNYSTDGTTADVTAKITINDKYTTTLEQTAFQLVYMSRVVWLAATNDAPLYHNSQKIYDTVTLSDLTDNYEPGNVTAKTVFTKSSALTWAGTVFEGEFEFYNTSGNQANMLLLGNTTNSRGLKVYLQNETTLRVRFQDKPGASARTKDVDITAENVQLEKFTNQKLKLKIQFDFKNYSTDGTTADVTAKITINDKYTTTLEQTAFQLVYMSRVVWLAATNDAPLYHNSQAQGGEVTPPEEEEPEEIGPVLNPNDYELVALSDLTDNYEEGNVTDNKTKYIKGETKTWVDTVFAGTFKFAHTGTDQANMLVLGHTSKGGLRIYVNKSGELQIRLHDYNTPNSASRVTDVKITAKQIGVEAIENAELKLKLYFDFENVNTDANTADVVVRVEINDKYVTAITQKDYQLAYMNRVAWLIGTKDYPLYHNSINEQTTGTEEVPTLNPNFKELTFASYEIKTGTYKYANKKLSAKGQAELDNLDGVIFSDTVNFSDEPGACICFGGVKTAWQGLNILSTAKGELQIKAATGKPFEPLVFKSEYAGVDLTGQDVEFTMSFEYVDADGDGQKNDVKLGVWFNGKAYRNKWYYLPNFAEQLGSHLGIYIPNEKTTLSIKTYTEPFVFEEFGFTKNWKHELRLKK